jgi:hypothetical protein
MKHKKDPGTIEMPLKPKRGRPTIYASALSDAERARRYRNARHDRMMASLSDLAGSSISKLCEYLVYIDINADPGTCLHLKHEIAAEIFRRCPKP